MSNDNDPMLATAAVTTDREFAADESFRTLFSEYIRAGYQALFIPTAEEARVENELRALAQSMNPPRGYISWDCIDGFSNPEAIRGQKKYMNCVEALSAVIDDSDSSPFNGNAFFHFKDLTDFQADPNVRRIIRASCENNRLVNRKWKRPLIITSPSDKLHDSLKPCITVLDFKLPNEQMLHRVLEFVKRSVERQEQVACTSELADEIVSALRGLSSTEAENTLARCIVRHKKFSPDLLETIRDEKAKIIHQSEILTYIPEERMAPREEIGGFDLLMAYLDRRCLAYSKQAQAVGLDFPKGIVLVGVPGTGKSYVAMAIGRLLHLPAYIMDIGAVFGSLVGESESRMRGVMRQVEAQQGCVLLIDEADKALGGAADSSGDSGTARRVFGQLLSWLSEKQDNTFVVVTLNRTAGIPAEFFRAGRFDAVFYTDLPHAVEREQILKIHLRKRGIDPDSLDLKSADWAQLVKDTENFVGSELEEVIREARYIAFEKRQTGTPVFEELMEARAGIIPLATLDAEGVKAIRDFCKNRCKPVSSGPRPPQSQPRTRAAATRTRGIDLS